MTKSNNNIEFSSEEIQNAIAILDKSLDLIESSIAPSLNSKFKVLSDLDLFSAGISKLQAQIKSLETSNKNLMTKIFLHNDDVEALEESIVADITSAYITQTSSYSGNRGSYYSDTGSVDVSDTYQNNTITEAELTIDIPGMDDEQYQELISFININKGNFTLNQILFNAECSGLLYLFLRKFYKDDTTELNVDVNDETLKVQKTLINRIFTSKDNDINSVIFKDNELLKEKEYFASIAKENNITAGDLLLDEKYEGILLTSMMKLYKGENLENYNIKEENLVKIKNYIDKIAQSKKITAEELLSDKKYLNILKGAEI